MFKYKNGLSIEIVNLLSEIDIFKGKWQFLKNIEPDRLKELRRTTIVTSSGASTRIEGAELSDQEIEARLLGLKIDKISNRSEEEVQSYIETLVEVLDNFDEIKITENYIKYLHKKILSYVSKDTRHRGDYKKNTNDVAMYENGKLAGIVMKTSSPFDTPFHMEKLITEFNKSWDEKEVHKLILISEFIIRFLKIHPFQDGNGRLSRILTNLLMLKAGYNFVEYSSHEKIIEDNKKKYYVSLRKDQKNLDDNIFPQNWTVFFLNIIQKQIKVLEDKISISESYTPVEEAILTLLKTESKVTNEMIRNKFDFNPNTVKSAFQKLVKKNKIIAYGERKGRHYKLYTPYAEKEK
jgi:Fic family protein